MFNMSLGEWIAVGTFLVSVIALSASLKLSFFKKTVKFSAGFIQWSPIYISELELDFKDNGYITKVACWLEAKFVNNTNYPIVITDILCFEDNLPKRPLEKTPIKKYKITNLRTDIQDSLSLPIDIEAHKALNFAFIADFEIPHKLGTVIFSMNNKALLAIPSVEKMRYLAKHSNEIFKPKLSNIDVIGIGIEDIQVSQLTFHFPILIANNNDIQIAENTISLPYGIVLNVLKFCKDHSINTESLFTNPYKNYNIEFVLGNGKHLNSSFEINYEVFWFNKFLQKGM